MQSPAHRPAGIRGIQERVGAGNLEVDAESHARTERGACASGANHAEGDGDIALGVGHRDPVGPLVHSFQLQKAKLCVGLRK